MIGGFSQRGWTVKKMTKAEALELYPEHADEIANVQPYLGDIIVSDPFKIEETVQTANSQALYELNLRMERCAVLEKELASALEQKAKRALKLDEEMIVATEHGVREARRFEILKIMLENANCGARGADVSVKALVEGSHIIMSQFEGKPGETVSPSALSPYFTEEMIRAMVELFLMAYAVRDQLVGECGDHEQNVAACQVARALDFNTDLLLAAANNYMAEGGT